MTDRSEQGRVVWLEDVELDDFRRGSVAVEMWPEQDESACHPVYVAPLREGEPHVGDRVEARGQQGEVVAIHLTYEIKPDEPRFGNFVVRASHLTPLPKKKRYRVWLDGLRGNLNEGGPPYVDVMAESADAARASLSVEEVEG